MSTTLSQIKRRISSYQEHGQKIPGVQAMDYMQHGSAVTIEVVTPIGSRLKTETQFVGYDDAQRRLYFALPELSVQKFDEFFIEQYWINISGISQQGEGSLVRFRNRIEHIITTPVKIFTLATPEEALIFEVRKEMRYRIDQLGQILTKSCTLDVAIDNISKNGCRFSFRGFAHKFEIDTTISISLTHPVSKITFTLTGIVRNISKQRGLNFYGVMFDEPGKQTVQTLLAQLMFNGSKLVFNQGQMKKQPNTNSA